MKPSQLMMALLAAAGLCLAGGGHAQSMNKDQRDMAVERAERNTSRTRPRAMACRATPRTSASKRPRAG